MTIHDDTYLALLRDIIVGGDSHDDRTGVGTTSVFGYQCRYDLADGFPLLTTKRMAWRAIVVELAWFLLGRTDNQWLTDRGVTIWNEWSTAEQCAKFGRSAGDLGPIYGHQWRDFGSTPGSFHEHISGAEGVDQIRNLCNDLEKNPNSRRLIVTGWNPAEATQVALPPCHTLWQCKVRTVSPEKRNDGMNQYLDLQLYQRSADAFLGVPFNIASYALLLQLLAHTHGMKAGCFIHAFGDLHIYNNHREQVRLQMSRTPWPSPEVLLPEDLRGRGFAGVMEWAARVEREALQQVLRPDTWPAVLANYVHHPSIKAAVAV